MLHVVTGDLFETAVDARVNAVNCVGVMGAGIAAVFKKQYPAMFRDYAAACVAGTLAPGQLHVWRTPTEWIINFPTKRHWRDLSRYADLERGLVALRDYLSEAGQPYLQEAGRKLRVAVPALGCGLGGLAWEKVLERLTQHFEAVEVDVFAFAPLENRRGS